MTLHLPWAMRKTSLLIVLALFLAGCRSEPSNVAAPVVVASNSFLSCAVADLMGDSAPILRLAEPGMCPGHFDVRPSQSAELRNCRVLFRLDFQKSLDARLSEADGLRIVEVRIAGGLCNPDSYLDACRQVADGLVAADLLDREKADARLAEIGQRIRQSADACRGLVAHLAGRPVVVSAHQADFVRWLGLAVAATFTGADTAAISQIESAIRSGERSGALLVIANEPEGRRVADALAERLGAKVAVFANFPATTFDDLLKDNVTRLLEASSQ